MAGHADVNAVDLTGVTDRDLAISAEREAAGTIKRVLRPGPEADWDADPGMDRLRTFVEIKTVWHPMGI